MMGDRSKLPEGFLEERDRELCLEVFDEYASKDNVNY
jgi:hypothetical protein